MITPVLGGDTTRVSGEYGTYCYIPGNIRSYGQGEIDRRMKELYNALSDTEKDQLSPGYDTGYIENVIIPNAITLPTGKKFVEFTVGGAGGSGTTFQSISEVLATMATIIKESGYGGVSGGATYSFFGLFETSFTASLLRGGEFEMSISGGVGDTKTWGISFTNNAPTAVAGAVGYTVRMYICQPSNLWAREVELFATDVVARSKIDFESSLPSKIMFVVSNIQDTLPPRR
jgi:hypothetical protein